MEGHPAASTIWNPYYRMILIVDQVFLQHIYLLSSELPSQCIQFMRLCQDTEEVRQDMRGGTVQEIGMQLTSKCTVTKTLTSDQAKLLSEFRRVVHDP